MIGKPIIGIRVINYRTYVRPSLLQYFVRPLAKGFFGLQVINNILIGFIALLYSSANFMSLLADEKHRAIHDRLSGTIALRTGQ
jgi:uncharacterized RDD family membrane protein YckC